MCLNTTAPQQLCRVQRAPSLVEQDEGIPVAKGQYFLSPLPCGFYSGFSCHSTPHPIAGKW